MKRKCIYIFSVIFLLSFQNVFAKNVYNAESDYVNFSNIIEKILPSVVTISAIKSNTKSYGSGIIIDKEGYILTSYHIIDLSKTILIDINDETLLAELIGYDELLDIALLKVSTKQNLTAAEFNSNKTQKIGDIIIIVGNPYNLGISVTNGIISALNRDLKINFLDNFIQVNAIINQGNSGGAMFDIEGKLIGLVSSSYSPKNINTSIGFAIPIKDTIESIEEIKKYGYVQRGWIGIKTKNIKKEKLKETNTNPKNKYDVIVSNIDENSSSFNILKISDIILSYNDTIIKSSKELELLVSSSKIGSIAKLKVLRNNEIVSLEVEIKEFKSNSRYDTEYKLILDSSVNVLDMYIIPITKEIITKYNLPQDISGFYVIETEKDGIADKNGIKNNDIIISFNQNSVKNIDEFIKKINENNDFSLTIKRKNTDNVLYIKK